MLRGTRLLAAVVLGVVACGADDAPLVSLRLVARDGEDPLEGAARLRIALESNPPVTVDPIDVGPTGFDVELDLPSVDELTRVRIVVEDEEGGVVSRGATPEAPLHLFTDLPLRVLLSRPGSAGAVTIAEWPVLEAAATLDGEWVVGLDQSGAFGMLDLLTLSVVAGVAGLEPAVPGARLVDLGEGRTLALGGGEGARVYDGRANLWGATGDGIEDGSFVEPAVASLPEGGAIAACGGRREVVAFGPDGAYAWTAELEAPRAACAIAVAGGVLVVYGGGDAEAPAAEVVDLADHATRVLVTEPDARTSAAAAAAGTRVLVLAGTRDGDALDDGVRLDPACADGCPEAIVLGAPRTSAVALSLDEDRVLLAGGGEPMEIVAAEDAVALPVEGPESDAEFLLRAGTGDVWWWGPGGAGVYAE